MSNLTAMDELATQNDRSNTINYFKTIQSIALWLALQASNAYVFEVLCVQGLLVRLEKELGLFQRASCREVDVFLSTFAKFSRQIALFRVMLYHVSVASFLYV